MKLAERSYSGKFFRPRPEIYVEKTGELVIVATPWGNRNSAKKAIQIIQDFFLSARQDNEATSPFAKLSCLSPIANSLRVAVKLANDTIYTEDNREEYLSGIELFAMARSQSETVWTQIGQPFPLLDRPHKGLMPLGTQQDLSTEFSDDMALLTPLPHTLLGLDPTSDFSIQSFHPQRLDKFVLVSRSNLPSEFYAIPTEERELDYYSKFLSQDNEEMPFWIGVI